MKWTSNDLKSNIRKAEKAGVEIVEKTAVWTPEERAEVDEGVRQWKKGRKGEQVASVSVSSHTRSLRSDSRFGLANVRSRLTGSPLLPQDSLSPWQDEAHRRYWVAQTAENKVSRLSPQHTIA